MAFLPLIGPLFASLGTAGAGAAAAGGAAAAAGGGLSLGTAASILGTGISAVGAIAGGAQANAAAKGQAAQMEMKAAEERAIAQRDAMEERRKGAVLQSNLIANAAAGGGSTEDPGIFDMLLDLDAVTEQNARLAMYQGESAAQQSMFGAKLQRAQGKQAMTGGLLSAGGALFSGLGSLGRTDEFRSYRAKYGDGISMAMG